MERVFNFSAGPGVLPEPVLEEAKKEIMNFKGSGMSVMEMSHRSPVFMDIFSETKASFKKVFGVPDSHEILFLQGGATMQFSAIPMNLLREKADYAVTGNFSQKAFEEAGKYGDVSKVFDSWNRIPSQSELLSCSGDYFYYCSNNTVCGTAWDYAPEVSAPLVCDMSSEILSRPVDVSRFGLIYAGAQKNMAPAGLTVVIIDKSLAGSERQDTPKMLSYKNMIDNDSMLNTPPCWCIYVLGLNLKWIENQGGLKAMEQLRRERAGLVYETLDGSSFYIPHAEPASRSMMNVTFRTPSKELDAEFVKGAAERGLVNLKGHKALGGIRASLYNAMPVEGAKKLVEYMKEFELSNV